ncbi:MAG: hypothetical protein IPG63_11740 [Xanthomonadales bacterium]|nr:hypothetical protein [Xanthomonadales bacterium]MBK7145725.1 hypothetical protein [Xanthomonadales bacterium]MCC6563012.1 hypothetical protein [Xanthomonadales bacterium]
MRLQSARLLPLSLSCLGLAAGGACAQTVTYDNPIAFAAATVALSLVSEDFESANVAAGAIANFASPLHAGTNNAVFAAGAMPVGVEIRSVPDSGGFTALGAGAVHFSIGPTASKMVLARDDVRAFDLLFSPPVTAVSLRAFSESDGVGIVVYGSSGLLASVQVTAPGDSGGFFGVTSTTPITRINVNAPDVTTSGNFEAIDDLRFGGGPLLFADGFE